jgi:hypothetical protein
VNVVVAVDGVNSGECVNGKGGRGREGCVNQKVGGGGGVNG